MEQVSVFGEGRITERATGKDMVVSRQAQEVQAAMVVAKRFPRDEIVAYDRIIQTCSRKSLAEQATYSYPRGGQKVEGPSIRLAEALAQAWGNIDYGIVELEQKEGYSEMMAYAWDLETNTRSTRVFTVKHEREKKGGSIELTSPRDIYEITANMGARRVRACILAVIPGDVVEAAVKQCKVTLASGNKEPFTDRLRKMVATFREKFNVTQSMIEGYIGYPMQSFSEEDLVKLIGVYNSLKDGHAKREDYFELGNAEKSSLDGDANDSNK